MEMDMMMDICNRMERDMLLEKANEYNVCVMTDELSKYNQISPKYNTIFDFEESSKEWVANKMSIGQGQYKYICGTFTKSGNKCKNKPMVNSDGKCHLHSK
jgi:hypothetical protein